MENTTVHDDDGRRKKTRRETERTRDTVLEQQLAETRALRAEVRTLRRLFDEFAGVFLNAKFKYGKPTDRWARRG